MCSTAAKALTPFYIFGIVFLQLIMDENNLDKNYLIQVTNNLYRLTLLFPKKEPLRYKMRELSDEVLANLISLSQETHYQTKFTLVRNSAKIIDILDGFLNVAKAQNWVKPFDLLSLQEEYSKIKEDLIKIERKEKDRKPEKQDKKTEHESAPVSGFKKQEKLVVSERQKKILKLLEEKGRGQVWEIKEILSDVSKRTLRRDFRDLLKQGLVERMGEKNNTFYTIKDRTQALMIGQG